LADRLDGDPERLFMPIRKIQDTILICRR